MDGRYATLLHEIMRRTDMSPAAKIVYMAIADRIGDNGHAWPGVRKIAADCGITSNMATRGVWELEKLGLMIVSRPVRGERRSNDYRLPSALPVERSTDRALYPQHSERSTGSTASALPVAQNQPHITNPNQPALLAREGQPQKSEGAASPEADDGESASGGNGLPNVTLSVCGGRIVHGQPVTDHPDADELLAAWCDRHSRPFAPPKLAANVRRFLNNGNSLSDVREALSRCGPDDWNKLGFHLSAIGKAEADSKKRKAPSADPDAWLKKPYLPQGDPE